MRNPERIDRICDELKKYWHCVPDWRFFQLINNLMMFLGKGDCFYVEDEEFESALKDFFRAC